MRQTVVRYRIKVSDPIVVSQEYRKARLSYYCNSKSEYPTNTTRVHFEFVTLGLQLVNDIATSIYLKICQKIENNYLCRSIREQL